jgi:drug/metabolite transporter (DMT)-like permease
MALATVTVWGTTFVITKILLLHGLTPSGIFFLRFALAYIGVGLLSWKRIWADSFRDELLFVASGLAGGSLYFLFENTALTYTLASNASLLICVAPILTTFLNRLFYRGDRIHSSLIYGSLMAFAGVALVVYNGGVVLKLNPLGDILVLLAALMWAFYSVIIKTLNGKYSALFVTRKVFFYGLLTTLPVFIVQPFDVRFDTLLQPIVWINLLFLGLVASMLCFISWNLSAKTLGIVRITNYVYFSPVVTLVTSVFLLHERITPIALAGSVLILSGVYLAEKGRCFCRKYFLRKA